MLYMCPFFHFLFTHTFSWKCLNHSWKVGINKNNLAVPASHSHGQPGITTPGNWSGIATSSRFVWMVKRCWRCYQCWFSMKILAEAWWLMGTNGTNLKIQLAWASLAASKHVGCDGIMVGCPIINPLNDGDMMGIWWGYDAWVVGWTNNGIPDLFSELGTRFCILKLHVCVFCSSKTYIKSVYV